MKNDYLELNGLKSLFDAGALKAVFVTKIPMQDGYMLQFDGKGGKTYMFKKQREDKARAFKSIDAAVANAEKIGFKKITVDIA